MNAVQILVMSAGLFGGLAFFLYGMSLMSDSLSAAAGGRLERSLKKFSRNPLSSLLLGTGITAAIQSSSALTVMLVGLVNSGMISFYDSFGLIMGTNIGTTLTAWLLSLAGISGNSFLAVLLQPMTFAPLLAFAGVVLRFLAKDNGKRSIGGAFIGFAILMCGMDMMGNAVNVLKELEWFKSLLITLSSPVAALLISTAFTAVIQSSAATIGIVASLALGGDITCKMAIPLVLGANIGTCITALLSSFGTNVNAKRVVAMHIYTNVLGSVVCVAAMYLLMPFVGSVLNSPISATGVALIHSLFNIMTALALMPCRKSLIRLCEITVKS